MYCKIIGRLLIPVILLCGCKVGPDYLRPGAPVACSYTQIAPEQGVHEQVGADLADWWARWNDPVLHELMRQAVACNPSLREAALRIQQARAQLGVTRSELFPQITADGSYSISKRSGISQSFETWDLGTGMNWEIDVFGRLRRYTEAAVADLEYERELYRDTYIILLSDVATAYITVRAYQRQIHVARQNIETRRHTLRLTEEKAQVVGTGSELDVHQARGSLKSVEAELPELQAGLRHTLNRIGILLGLPPGSRFDDLLARPDPIPTAPEMLCVGIPAELLRRRPDIQAVERKVAAQTARIGGAVGDLYPMFSLTGDFGVSASNFRDLWNADSIAAGVGPAFRWNVLNFGKYRSNVRLQEFLQKEWIVRYQEAVLLAAEEVDNALASYVHEKERRVRLADAVDSYTWALQYSEERYRTGTADFQRVLDSQREKLNYETLLTVCEASVIQHVVQLYRALGGGWQYPLPEPGFPPGETTPEPVPTIAPTPPGVFQQAS